MGTLEEDLAWSRHHMEISSDKVKELFNKLPVFKGEKLKIYPVENVDEPMFKLLDRKCGIDYFITNSDGTKIISFAWRASNSTVKRCKNEGVYNAFSLRKRRNKESSKTENCEIAKRLYAINTGLTYPLYTVEACFIDDTLLSLAIANTRDVYHAYTHCPIRITNPNTKEKEVFFYGVSWQIMKECGYTIYDWYLNDKCKRTYKLDEFCLHATA